MFAPLVSYIWDNILGFSIYVYLLSHHWETILGSNVCCFFVTFFSQFILCSFHFSLFRGIIRFYLNIIFCSIGLSSLGHHRKFFLSKVVTLFFIQLVSNHWGTIQVSISFYSLFIFCLISGTLSQVYLSLIVCSIGLLSLAHRPNCYPYFSPFPFFILNFISFFPFFIWFRIIGTPSQV